MKADLYVQGHFWASIDIPGDSLIALLAKGMITEAQQKANQLKQDLNSLEGVSCSISLRIKEPTTYPPGTSDQHHQEEITWPDKERPNCSSMPRTSP